MIRMFSILALFTLGVSIFLITKDTPSQRNNTNTDYSFTLKSKDKIISLDNFKDKAVILYFGYMNCPDICPTTLSDINEAFEFLNEGEKQNTQVIFISVDPSRDTIINLDSYAKYFNQNFIGATNDEKIIKNLTNRYQAYYAYKKEENSALKYTVSHTTRIYILDSNHHLSSTLSTHNIKISQISDAIKIAIKAK